MNTPYHPNQPIIQPRQVAPNVQPDTGGLEFLTGERSDVEFQKAVRHSGVVRLLRVLLPVVAIIVILLIAGALIVRQFFVADLDIGNIKVDGGKLVMENPKLNGVDQNQRPYNLSADRAIQDAQNPSVVELQKINARLPMDEEISADIIAGNGVYDADAKTLVLKENVEVKTSNGMSIKLSEADVDIKNGVLRTSSPITATSPQADISSSSLLVEQGGDRLIFDGNVQMTLRPKDSKKANEATNVQN